MVDFVIFGPTYKRPELLAEQVMHLSREVFELGLSVVHIVLDDGSPEKEQRKYQKIVERMENSELYKFHFSVAEDAPYGATGHWRMINQLLLMAQKYDSRYFLFTYDDVAFCNGVLAKSMEMLRFYKLLHSDFTAMSLYTPLVHNWGSNSYVNQAFVADRWFFKTLEWRIGNILEASVKCNNPHLGVFKQLTQRGLHHIAPAPPVSLARLVDTPSVMFPERLYPARRIENIEFNNFIG